MNYVSVVYVVVGLVMVVDWTVRGKRSYRGQEGRRTEGRNVVGVGEANV